VQLNSRVNISTA